MVELAGEFERGTISAGTFWTMDFVSLIIVSRKDEHMAYPPKWNTFEN